MRGLAEHTRLKNHTTAPQERLPLPIIKVPPHRKLVWCSGEGVLMNSRSHVRFFALLPFRSPPQISGYSISRVDINHQGYYYLLLALWDTNES